MRRIGKIIVGVAGYTVLVGCAGYRGEWPLLGDKPEVAAEPAEIAPVAEPEPGPVNRLPRVIPSELDDLMARSRDDYAAQSERIDGYRADFTAAKARIVPGAPQEGGRAWWDAQMALTRLAGMAESLENLRRRLAAMKRVLADDQHAPSDTGVARQDVVAMYERVNEELADLHAYLAAERRALAGLN